MRSKKAENGGVKIQKVLGQFGISAGEVITKWHAPYKTNFQKGKKQEVSHVQCARGAEH